MPLGIELGLGPGDFVLDGDPDPPPKGAHPQFSAHVYCGERAGCIRIPLGMEVGLGPGDFVLDEDPVPPLRKGHSSPLFAQQPPLVSARVYCGHGLPSQLLVSSCYN